MVKEMDWEVEVIEYAVVERYGDTTSGRIVCVSVEEDDLVSTLVRTHRNIISSSPLVKRPSYIVMRTWLCFVSKARVCL